jgi:uncharacterized paraquat-inducible protein A
VRTMGRIRKRYPNGDKPGSGPGGRCVCPKCGMRTNHTRAVPCNEIKCPKCNTTMTKE